VIDIITQEVLRAVMYLFWLCSVGSLVVGILAICSVAPRIPRRSEFAVVGAGWICLVTAGIVCQDVGIFAFTLPLLFVCFGIAALLWRSSGFPWGKAPTLCYWVGVLSVIVGVVYFGGMAGLIECIETHCHPLNTLPPRPNVALELILWSLPAVLVCLGLIMSKHFGRFRIAIAVTLLLLVNPTILLVVASLHLRLGI